MYNRAGTVCLFSHRSCEKKVAGWSDCVTKQLDLDHQQLFPAVLAYK